MQGRIAMATETDVGNNTNRRMKNRVIADGVLQLISRINEPFVDFIAWHGCTGKPIHLKFSSGEMTRYAFTLWNDKTCLSKEWL